MNKREIIHWEENYITGEIFEHYYIIDIDIGFASSDRQNYRYSFQTLFPFINIYQDAEKYDGWMVDSFAFRHSLGI